MTNDDLPKRRPRHAGKEDRPKVKSKYSSQSRYTDAFLKEQQAALRRARDALELPGQDEGMEKAQRLDKHILEINEELELRHQDREAAEEQETIFQANNMRFPSAIALHIGQHGTASAVAVVAHNFVRSARGTLTHHYKLEELKRYPPDIPDDDILRDVQKLTAWQNRRRNPDMDKPDCPLYIEFGSRGQDIYNRYLDMSLAEGAGLKSINITYEGDKAQVGWPRPVVIVGRVTIGANPLVTKRNTSIVQVAEVDIISILKNVLANRVLHLKSIDKMLVELMEKEFRNLTIGARKISQEERILLLEPGCELPYAISVAIAQIYEHEFADARTLSPEVQKQKAHASAGRALEGRMMDHDKRACVGVTQGIKKSEYTSSPNSSDREGGRTDEGRDDYGGKGYRGPRNL